jgi:hypothetical protein
VTDLTTEQKLQAIETSGLEIVWDGCHKMYLLETPADRKEASFCGYDLSEDVYPASEVRKLFKKSCGLLFLHAMSLRDDFPWDIPQGDEEVWEIFWPEEAARAREEEAERERVLAAVEADTE